MVFGELTVVQWLKDRQRWECRCSCGNPVYCCSGDLYSISGKKKHLTKRCRTCADKRTRARLVKDITGVRNGKLVAIRPTGESTKPINGSALWLCRCDCGTELVLPSYTFLNTKKGRGSCGCRKITRTTVPRIPGVHNKLEDISGLTFGRLTVLRQLDLEEITISAAGNRVWLCQCSCGSTSQVPTGRLQNGTTKSCGCIGIERLRAMKGPLSHTYNPLLTDEERAGRHRMQGVDNARMAAYKRDDFICSACGQRGGKLHAHHIKPWLFYPNHRLMLRNLITLCQRCHTAFHVDYGRRADNHSYFIPWLRERRQLSGYKN